MRGEDLSRAVGLADCCELAAILFAFPGERLAEGLSSGTVLADAETCLEEAGSEPAAAEAACGALSGLKGANAGELLDALRKGYSLLYLAPGLDVPVWPYESAFLLREGDRDAVPSLFRSACTLDVERQMREAGALPKTARTEPCDSAWDELSFMSFLYGRLAAALSEGREEDAAVWRSRIRSFWSGHASDWLPAFMKRTSEAAPTLRFGAEYAQLAALGSAVLAAISASVEGEGD